MSSILVCAVCNMYSIAIVFVVSLCRMYSMYPVLCSIWLVVTAGGHVVPTERQNSLSDVSLAATCSNWAPKWPRHITAGWTRYTDRPIPNSIPLPLVMTKYTHWPARNILLGNWLWNAKASYTRILNHDMHICNLFFVSMKFLRKYFNSLSSWMASLWEVLDICWQCVKRYHLSQIRGCY